MTIDVGVPVLGHIDELYDLYVRLVAGAPHCRFVPSAERFSGQLLGATPPPALYTLPREHTRFVAARGAQALGSAALTRYQDFDGRWYQSITGLFFEDEAAGRALIAACEAAAGAGVLDAFPKSHGKTVVSEYNGGWDGLSDRVPGVARVLAAAGYAPFYRELHMALDLRRFPAATAATPAGMRLQHRRDERGRDGVALIDDVTGAEAGGCGFGTMAHLAEGPGAERVGYVWWLGVEEGYRRRGVARALMAEALAALAAQGCEEVWLTTGADNWPAQPLYLSLGFAAVDCSACFRRGAGRTEAR